VENTLFANLSAIERSGHGIKTAEHHRLQQGILAQSLIDLPYGNFNRAASRKTRDPATDRRKGNTLDILLFGHIHYLVVAVGKLLLFTLVTSPPDRPQDMYYKLSGKIVSSCDTHFALRGILTSSLSSKAYAVFGRTDNRIYL